MECPICLLEITTNKYKTWCNHTFHKECLKEAYKRKKTCPMCRADATHNPCFDRKFGIIELSDYQKVNRPIINNQRLIGLFRTGRQVKLGGKSFTIWETDGGTVGSAPLWFY